MSEGEWRVDHTSGVQTAHDSTGLASLRSIVRRCSGVSLARNWTRHVIRWARLQVGHRPGFPEISWEEEIIHDLGTLVEREDDRGLIERAFLESVRRLTTARSVRWLDEPAEAAGDEEGATCVEIVLQIDSTTRPRTLQLRFSDPAKPLSQATLKRLKTVSRLVASSLLRNDLEHSRRSSSVHEATRSTASTLTIASRGLNRDQENQDIQGNRSLPLFHDATFLHAVLPFALGLARRHGEPLSLLCVSIDRLSGIHELLGSGTADRAIRNVATHIAGMIRDSDIVARLDDDRILVMLPYALLSDACNLGREICHTIQATPHLLPELPALTVSIGVAEFPACAEDVYSLLDSADHALSMARQQGRNQAVAASAQGSKAAVNQARQAS